MAKLKTETMDKCMSILEDFVKDSSSDNKERASLALNQLRKITAGSGDLVMMCLGRPRVDSISPVMMCLGRPRVDS